MGVTLQSCWRVPLHAVFAGVPAKRKRYRFIPEMIETLLCTQWWEWSREAESGWGELN